MQLHPLANFFRAKLIGLRLDSKVEAKFGQKGLDLDKFDWICAKSKSCIPKNTRSSTTMFLPVMCATSDVFACYVRHF